MLALALLGLGVVHLRTEQARSAARTLALEAKWIELRSRWWEVQSHVARLRTPERIRDRIGRVQTDLVPPGERRGPSSARLATREP